MDEHRDCLFATALEQVGEFQFDEATARVFDDMIKRSVPGYRMTVAMTALIARYFAQPQSRLYDLGCSLGACTFAMATQTATDPTLKNCRVVGVDSAAPMIERCRRQRDEVSLDHVDFLCGDIRDAALDRASVAVLNFTLQFLPIDDRRLLLGRIFDAMLPGGVLILSEKIRLADREAEELLYQLHHEFKRANGYAEMEISQKRDSLENVLIREPLATHIDRLSSAGFSTVTPWLQCFNFVSLLARKSRVENV